LCMHPVEHLYYFSCIAPSLYLYMSPFIFAWNGWHLLLSPAASHSGWEDHMQSDQFHYLHHARFECNYGSASIPLDNMFGTFFDVLIKPEDDGDKEKNAELPKDGGAKAVYTMEDVAKHTSKDDCWIVLHDCVLDVTSWLPNHPGGERVILSFGGKNATATFNTIHPAGVIEKYTPNAVIGMLEGATPAAVGGDSKAPLLANHEQESQENSNLYSLLPTRDNVVYFSLTLMIFVVLWLAITSRFSLDLYPFSVAALVGFGPIASAVALCMICGEKLDLRWPFQHESLFGKLGLHLVVGFLVGVLPVYHTLTTVMAEPVFCQLWDPMHDNLCMGVKSDHVATAVLGM